MAIARTDILDHLASQFGTFQTAGGVTATDVPGNANSYADTITSALLAVGVAWGDRLTATVAESKAMAVFAAADVYALRKFARYFGTQPSYNVATGVTENYGNLLRMALDLLADAESTAVAAGAAIVGAAGIRSARRVVLNTNHIEQPNT